MSTPEAIPQGRGRRQLLLLFALFLLPPVAAWLAWQYLGDAGVESTTNAGTLVSPARPLSASGLQLGDGTQLTDGDLRGFWTYVVFAPDGCAEICKQQLYLTRQVRIAMNKDIGRVQRLLVLGKMPAPEFAQHLASEHPDLRWVVSGAGAEATLATFRGERFGPTGAQYFLLDPLGNLMMFYDLEVAAKGMMRDLQKLLKISQIG
jgi:hypothetical protein